MKKIAILVGDRHSGKSALGEYLSKKSIYYIDFDGIYNEIEKKYDVKKIIEEDDESIYNIVLNFLIENYSTIEKNIYICGTVIAQSLNLLYAFIEFASRYNFIISFFKLKIPESDRYANYITVKEIYKNHISENSLEEFLKYDAQFLRLYQSIYNLFPVLDFFDIEGDWTLELLNHDFYQTFDFPFFAQQGLTNSPQKWIQICDFFPSDMHNLKVLDIGSNEGYFSLKLASRGANVTSLEYDPHIAQVAYTILEKANNFSNRFSIEIINKNINELSNFKDNEFDYVLCLSVLHHVPLFNTIREMARIVKNQLILEVLIDKSIEGLPYCLVTDNPVNKEVIPSCYALEKILQKFFSNFVFYNKDSERIIVVCNK